MARECEDCGDEIPKGQRRYRCKNCNALVCGYCKSHIHDFAAMIARDRHGDTPQ